MKVTVVGAGNVGATCAQRIAENSIADVYLVDVLEGLAAGKALDLAEAAPIVGHGRRITGGTEYGPAEGSDLVVITAGIARKPGMSRDDLLATNGRIISEVVTNVMAHAPEAILLMVSNPLDVTTYIAQQVSGHPRERVFGMAGVLDTARFRTFIAMELDCSPEDVTAMVLGGHGDSMVPVGRSTKLKGIPVSELLKPERLRAVIEQTRYGGAEIVGLLKTGSAFHAPSAAVFVMVEAILRDTKRVLPASVYLDGQYGIRGCFIGIPVRLGAGGVEERQEIELAEEELTALRRSAELVEKTFNELCFS